MGTRYEASKSCTALDERSAPSPLDERSAPSADLRHDPLTGAIALAVPRWRTAKAADPPNLALELPAGTSPCPFCPEQSDDPSTNAGEETARVPGGPRHRPWTAMSLRNRWPHTLDGAAAEVVVLSDLHDTHLGNMSPAEARVAVELLLDRAEAQRRSGLHPLVFVNYGVNAGSTQPHPHGQVVGLPEPDPVAAAETDALTAGRCVLCREIPTERLVTSLPGVSVATPVAPTVDYDQIVVLDAHGPAEARAVAAGIATALGTLFAVAGPVAYNLLVHLEGHPHVHVTPRTVRHSGYELAGIHPCYVAPETATVRLAHAARVAARVGSEADAGRHDAA